jgi:preprotein translocase subunit SecG
MIIQIVLAIAITIAILLQKSSSIGLGAYSGSNESLFGAKGPMGFLAKITFVLGLLFVVNTLALGYLYNQANTRSVTDTIKVETPTEQPLKPFVPASAEKTAPAAPAAPAAPTAPTSK